MDNKTRFGAAETKIIFQLKALNVGSGKDHATIPVLKVIKVYRQLIQPDVFYLNPGSLNECINFQSNFLMPSEIRV